MSHSPTNGSPQAAENSKQVNTLEKTAEDLLDEIIDLEEYAKSGKPPRPARGYKIRIDKTTYTVHVQMMTGRQLLELAGKIPPEDYILRQIHVGGRPEKVELTQEVDFSRPGIEKFKTMPRNAQDGRDGV